MQDKALVRELADLENVAERLLLIADELRLIGWRINKADASIETLAIVSRLGEDVRRIRIAEEMLGKAGTGEVIDQTIAAQQDRRPASIFASNG